MEKEIVIYRYRGMISASQNMIYAGGEFRFDIISKFGYPASSSRLRALTKVIVVVYRLRDMIYG